MRIEFPTETRKRRSSDRAKSVCLTIRENTFA
jgi:hypothetical protein